MIRKIVLYGDPVLRAKGATIKEITPEIRELADDMLETMRDADGVGIAAQQVGEALQIAVVDVSHAEDASSYFRINGEDRDMMEMMPLFLINPKVDGSDDRESDTEGCLSFPDIRSDIRRPASVTAKFMTLDGEEVELEADGLLARAIQHEVDHLNGILFIDRMSSAKKISLRKSIKSIQKQGEAEAKMS